MVRLESFCRYAEGATLISRLRNRTGTIQRPIPGLSRVTLGPICSASPGAVTGILGVGIVYLE